MEMGEVDASTTVTDIHAEKADCVTSLTYAIKDEMEGMGEVVSVELDHILKTGPVIFMFELWRTEICVTYRLASHITIGFDTLPLSDVCPDVLARFCISVKYMLMHPFIGEMSIRLPVLSDFLEVRKK